VAEDVIAIALGILVVALVAAISFWSGARYCATTMLPRIVARKTSKELDHFADAVDAERTALGLGDEEDAEAA
jgi:hypothetical protein